MNITQLERRLATAEQKTAQRSHGDIRTGILRGRVEARPQRTRAYLEQLALEPGLVGQMARGDLRLRRIGTSTAPINPDHELPLAVGSFYADPLGFVLWSYDWGADPSTRVVKLPAAYAERFDSEFGPDAWASALLDDIGAQVRERGFNGRDAVEPIRLATASGHGIGKSTITSWIILWIMATRPNARGTVTANTSAQLASKTWSELMKWLRRCAVAEWFEATTGKASMRMAHRDSPEAWRCDAQTSREENSESFAGQHAADSTSFYVFDEASAIPEKIWEVAEGGLSDGEPMLLAFGNPTRNTGAFHAAFNGQRHRWTTRQIDSRDVAITNKTLIAEWLDDFGVDSDFFKVRVRGVFPSASSLQFVGRDQVDAAMLREVAEVRGETVVLGVDPARFGDDSSVIVTRVGRDARTWPVLRFAKLDTQQLAARIAERVNFFRAAGRRVAINIDGTGVGGGVVDRMRSLGFDVTEIGFGERALDPRKFANRRAEIWGAMRDWIAVGALPLDQDLATDLCGVEYAFNTRDALQLESKQSMKSRGLSSPDAADALACTFGVVTPIAMHDDDRWGDVERERLAVLEYDPMAPRR